MAEPMPDDRSQVNRRELLELARQGDREALDQLLGAFRRQLVTAARTQLSPGLQHKADASDLAQETLLEAHRHFTAFRGVSEAEFATWLRKILGGLVANHARRYLGTKRRDARRERPLAAKLPGQSSEAQAPLIAAGVTPSQEAVKQESQERLLWAVAQLPEHYRQVVQLRHIEGRPLTEVAEQTGRSVESAHKLLSRALARLRKVLGS